MQTTVKYVTGYGVTGQGEGCGYSTDCVPVGD